MTGNLGAICWILTVATVNTALDSTSCLHSLDDDSRRCSRVSRNKAMACSARKGAHGTGSTASVARSVVLVQLTFHYLLLPRSLLQMSYRTIIFQQGPLPGTVWPSMTMCSYNSTYRQGREARQAAICGSTLTGQLLLRCCV
jgi:hypothetical protein